MPKDFIKAYAWATVAAGQGDTRAPSLKDWIRAQMTPAEFAPARHLAGADVGRD